MRTFLIYVERKAMLPPTFCHQLSYFLVFFPFLFHSPGKYITTAIPFRPSLLCNYQGAKESSYSSSCKARFITVTSLISIHIARTFWQQENVFSCASYNFVQVPFPIDQENSGLKCIK